MARLGDTVADLLARSRAMAAPPSAVGLRAVTGFGSNPGALQMEVHLPPDLPTGAPLVVVLHGCGQTAAGYAAGVGWIELADRYGFALLCPAQARANNPNLCFNWFEPGDIARGGGEAASVAAMIRHAIAAYDLDPRRVFITGLSAGGAMAAVMLATYPELFAAGAIIAGLPYAAASSVGEAMSVMRRPPQLSARAWGDRVRGAAPAPARWPKVSIWRGDADTTVLPASSDALVLQWSDVHGATASSATTRGAGRDHRTWVDGRGEVVVELHALTAFGHGAPISAAGAEGCGAPAPWILEAGISSSQEIARSWGIDARQHPGRPVERFTKPSAASSRAPGPAVEVAGVISRALRQAGLMR